MEICLFRCGVTVLQNIDIAFRLAFCVLYKAYISAGCFVALRLGLYILMKNTLKSDKAVHPSD
jgi:hypothetical protein